MQSGKKYDLFISHSWDYDRNYYGLIELLEGEASLDWYNRSVPRSAPVLASDLAGIRSALARRIYQADAVLVVSDQHLDKSEWVRFELNTARELGTPIIGIQPWKPAPASVEVGDTATRIVGWTADTIAQTIKVLAA